MTQDQLLAEIEAFLRCRRMNEHTFGRLAVNDGKFIARIRGGGGVTLRTASRVRKFMDDQRAAERREHRRLGKLIEKVA